METHFESRISDGSISLFNNSGIGEICVFSIFKEFNLSDNNFDIPKVCDFVINLSHFERGWERLVTLLPLYPLSSVPRNYLSRVLLSEIKVKCLRSCLHLQHGVHNNLVPKVATFTSYADYEAKITLCYIDTLLNSDHMHQEMGASASIMDFTGG